MDILLYDDDNDIVSNFEEIKVGRSPIHHQDTSLSQLKQLSYAYFPSAEPSQDCPSINAIQRQATYEFTVDNIALVETLAYVDPSTGPFNLSHEAGENVLLILFVSSPLDPSRPKEYYGSIVKVSSNVEGLNIVLNPVDFIKLQ